MAGKIIGVVGAACERPSAQALESERRIKERSGMLRARKRRPRIAGRMGGICEENIEFLGGRNGGRMARTVASPISENKHVNHGFIDAKYEPQDRRIERIPTQEPSFKDDIVSDGIDTMTRNSTERPTTVSVKISIGELFTPE